MESKGDGQSRVPLAAPRWSRQVGTNSAFFLPAGGDVPGVEGWPLAGRDGDREDLASKHIKGVCQDAVVSTNKLLSPGIAPLLSSQLADAPNLPG